jgi:hypothetical protein
MNTHQLNGPIEPFKRGHSLAFESHPPPAQRRSAGAPPVFFRAQIPKSAGKQDLDLTASFVIREADFQCRTDSLLFLFRNRPTPAQFARRGAGKRGVAQSVPGREPTLRLP